VPPSSLRPGLSIHCYQVSLDLFRGLRFLAFLPLRLLLLVCENSAVNSFHHIRNREWSIIYRVVAWRYCLPFYFRKIYCAVDQALSIVVERTFQPANRFPLFCFSFCSIIKALVALKFLMPTRDAHSMALVTWTRKKCRHFLAVTMVREWRFG